MASLSNPASRYALRSVTANRLPCCPASRLRRSSPSMRLSHRSSAPTRGLLAEAAQSVKATVPVRIASEMGRQEFVLVALVPGEHGPVAFPIGKGSGAVTSFSQADGFVAIDALSTGLDPGVTNVTLIGSGAKAPDIVIMGSHCVPLDAVIHRLAEHAFSPPTAAIRSMGAVA